MERATRRLQLLPTASEIDRVVGGRGHRPSCDGTTRARRHAADGPSGTTPSSAARRPAGSTPTPPDRSGPVPAAAATARGVTTAARTPADHRLRGAAATLGCTSPSVPGRAPSNQMRLMNRWPWRRLTPMSFPPRRSLSFGTLVKGDRRERSGDCDRHPLQRSRCPRHRVGRNSARPRVGRTVLDLDGPRRRSSSCHAARCGVAGRSTALHDRRHRTEGTQPAARSACDPHDRLQHLGSGPRRRCRRRRTRGHRQRVGSNASPPRGPRSGTDVGDSKCATAVFSTRPARPSSTRCHRPACSHSARAASAKPGTASPTPRDGRVDPPS